MYKTVNFNIFDEHLEHIVYGEDFSARSERDIQPEKAVEHAVEKKTELIIHPLNRQNIDCQRKIGLK